MKENAPSVARSHSAPGGRASEQGPKTLTERELRFVEEYAKDANGTQAAIRAGFSKRSAGTLANRMLKKVEICARLEQLRTPLRETAGLALADHVSELERLKKAAEADGNWSAAINAELARGRALGHQSGLGAKKLEDMDLSEFELEEIAQGRVPRRLKLA